MQDENWPRAVEQHYGFDGLYAMQNAWLDWVKQGRPQLTPETSPIAQLVSSRASQPPGTALAAQPILRMQSPDDIRPVSATSVEPGNGGSGGAQVTVASGSGSVYAAAAQAERQRKEASGTAAAKSAVTSTAPGPSIYDASLGSSALRR
jgi:hypothetical protein